MNEEEIFNFEEYFMDLINKCLSSIDIFSPFIDIISKFDIATKYSLFKGEKAKYEGIPQWEKKKFEILRQRFNKFQFLTQKWYNKPEKHEAFFALWMINPEFYLNGKTDEEIKKYMNYLLIQNGYNEMTEENAADVVDSIKKYINFKIQREIESLNIPSVISLRDILLPFNQLVYNFQKKKVDEDYIKQNFGEGMFKAIKLEYDFACLNNNFSANIIKEIEYDNGDKRKNDIIQSIKSLKGFFDYLLNSTEYKNNNYLIKIRSVFSLLFIIEEYNEQIKKNDDVLPKNNLDRMLKMMPNDIIFDKKEIDSVYDNIKREFESNNEYLEKKKDDIEKMRKKNKENQEKRNQKNEIKERKDEYMEIDENVKQEEPQAKGNKVQSFLGAILGYRPKILK